MKLKFTLFLFAFAAIFSAQAQETQEGPTFIGEVVLVEKVPSIASRMSTLTLVEVNGEAKDGRYSKVRRPSNEVIPGKGMQSDYLAENPNVLEGKILGKAADLVFDAGFTGANPTDPALAIGPDHVFVVWNTAFAIFDKDGNNLAGPFSPNPAIFPAGGCCDLTVSYDNAADRWVVGFLGGGVQVAVSETGNPLTTNWNVYLAPLDDYNKLSVWSDGYYMTNQPGPTRLFAMDRDAMLAGDPTASIQGFSLPDFSSANFASPQALNVTDGNLPAIGNAPIVFLQDDAYAGVTVDHIKFWNANVDYDTPANSTISMPQEIPVTPFTSVFDGTGFANLTQPNPGGGTLDALQGIIMNQAQFRKFPTHNSAVFNHVVDTDPTGGERAAIRWYEFRQATDGAPWTLFQEGTYESPNNKHAWNASLMMDIQGNIGMGYTGMSIAGTGTTNVSSYYTGRFVSDPLGTMTIAEEPIAIGDGVIVGSRYGDYSKIDIDPIDDQTFYFANEVHTAATPNNQRAANVGRFKVNPDATSDAGVIAILTPQDGALSNTETISVMIRNYGIQAISNVPVSFTVNGGTEVNEVFTGTIPAESNIMYTFTATADLGLDGTTFTLCASTALAGDEIPENDEFCQDITHLNDNDTGVVSLDAPSSGSDLGVAEAVTVTIQNFGAATQTSIPVFYTLDAGTPVMETYTGSIAQGATDTYTFTTTVDLSVLGDFDFTAGTELAGDADTSNDDTASTVSNSICQPTSNCAGFNDGVTELSLADQDISTNCGDAPAGYSDDTDIVFNFIINEEEDNIFDGVLQTGFEDSNFVIWIDFDDNNEFTSDEIIASGITGPVAATDTAFTVNFADIPGVTSGMHLMRVRGGDENFGTGDVSEPCGDLQFGRTNDYTANVSGILGVEGSEFANAEFLITTLADNQFEVLFNTTDITNDLPLFITNTLGQRVGYYVLENTGNGYSKMLDMSYVSAGVYFVKIGTDNLNKVQRIIVR